jgi:hypothetical protein
MSSMVFQNAKTNPPDSLIKVIRMMIDKIHTK